MRLIVPTDFEILRAFADGRRNNAVNLAHKLDRNRSYINTRLPVLADYELIERVGPAPNSGLYAITERGAVAADNQAAYEDDDIDFDALIESQLGGSGGDDAGESAASEADAPEASGSAANGPDAGDSETGEADAS